MARKGGSRPEIFAFLRQLADQGSTMLVVEQYVHKVLDLADLAYALVHGHIVFAGESAELRGADVMARYLGEEAPAPGARVRAGRR